MPPYKMLFVCKRNPAPNWKPVSSPDVLDYVRITQNGLQPGQGIFKQRSEFLDSLPFITRYTASDKEELYQHHL
jgi:hypothetical protein